MHLCRFLRFSASTKRKRFLEPFSTSSGSDIIDQGFSVKVEASWRQRLDVLLALFSVTIALFEFQVHIAPVVFGILRRSRSASSRKIRTSKGEGSTCPRTRCRAPKPRARDLPSITLPRHPLPTRVSPGDPEAFDSH